MAWLGLYRIRQQDFPAPGCSQRRPSFLGGKQLLVSLALLHSAAACGNSNSGLRRFDGGDLAPVGGAVDGPTSSTGGSPGFPDLGTPACMSNDDCMSPMVCNINTDGACGPASYTQIDVSGTTTCAVVSDGSLFCWGGNPLGEMGPTTTGNHLVPFRIPYQQKVRTVATGYGFTCVLLLTGQVDCWGQNGNGALGCANPQASSMGPLCTPYPPGSAISQLVAGAERACVGMSKGIVQCWGRNDHYDLGDGTNVSKYAPVTVLGIETAIAIASGVWQACAVLEGGSAKCWGANNRAELGNGTTAATPSATFVSGLDGKTDKVMAVSAAEDHSCLVLEDGSIRCFGENLYGELGDGKTVMSLVPVVAQFPKGATDVATGIQFTCALFGSSTMQCLGKGGAGQLGNGAFAQSPSPVVVNLPEGTFVKALAAKFNHICVLGSEGRLWCWGDNSSGQLGTGTNKNASRPFEVPMPGVH